MTGRLEPYLFTGSGSPPAEYVTYQLCTLLSCLPSQLRRESVEDVQALLACVGAEQSIRARKDGPGLDPSTRGAGMPEEATAWLNQST